MTSEEFTAWAESFERLHARFCRFFRRSETKEAARQYLRGLLSGANRKNCWQMAEAVGEKDPQRLQRLLWGATWDEDAFAREVREYVVEEFGHPEGIGVLDESAFVKKGTRSAGVKPQWCSCRGKTENCQVGVFLSYTSPRGYAFLSRRLYLPEEWCQDEERRQKAKVPKEVEFATKTELGRQMLESAWKAGVPMAAVTADERYGISGDLRDWIHQQGRVYVMAVPVTTRVWEEPPPVVFPRRQAGSTGEPPKARPAPEAPPAQEARTVVAAWGPQRWQRLAVAPGERGPRTSDWAAARVTEYRDKHVAGEVWLLARRSLSQPEEISYYLSNAPADTPLLTLCQIAASRWSVEQCFEESKGQCGLDEYEVRDFPSWQRHTALSMLAHAWLSVIRRQEREAGEKGGEPGDGGALRGGDPAAVGGGAAVAHADGSADHGLVPVAAEPTAAGAAQSLSALHRLHAARASTRAPAAVS